MKTYPIFTSALFLGAVGSLSAQVLLHDTWSDGTRDNTNLPQESAWFASSAGSLTVQNGSLTGAIPSGSVLWLTYFTPPGSPASLQVGETLNARAVFTLTGVGGQNTSRGLRLGLFNFSEGGTRVASDSFSTGSGGGAPGANVTGYLLNMNFGTSFGVDSPLQIMERTATTSVNLMGASGDFTALSSGPSGRLNTAAFTEGTEYTLQLAVTRTTEDSIDILTRFTGGDLDISHTATDSVNGQFQFDTLALRPSGSANVATSIQFRELHVAVVPEPSAWALLLLGAALTSWKSRKR